MSDFAFSKNLACSLATPLYLQQTERKRMLFSCARICAVHGRARSNVNEITRDFLVSRRAARNPAIHQFSNVSCAVKTERRGLRNYGN